MEPKESKILLDHEICRGLIYQTHLLFLGSYFWGQVLFFACLKGLIQIH